MGNPGGNLERHHLRADRPGDFPGRGTRLYGIRKGEVMSLENVLLLIVSAVVMVYLIFALLWPEKF